ncbi:MAG: D-glycero-beta-D-manno-heptose 1-phosphate adenylyltransferase [Bacteroidota bacterium]
MSITKIVKLHELEMDAEYWKGKGELVVFTNGVFDILHFGHCSYLEKAARLGDRLVIGLNSDASVKRLGKGEDRPINSEEARASVLSCLYFVDRIVVFDQDTPEHLITSLLPDILVKGSDYNAYETDSNSKEYIVGSDIVRDHGGKVKTVNLVEGYSTTSIIDRIKNG